MSKTAAPKAKKSNVVLYVCERFPSLNLVVKSNSAVESLRGSLSKIAGQHINFVPQGFRGKIRGEFRTSDPELIEYIESHNYFEQGIIVRAKSAEVALKDRKAPQRVEAEPEIVPAEPLEAAPEDAAVTAGGAAIGVGRRKRG